MTAKEMFEELGFKFKEEKDTWQNAFGKKLITGHEFVYKCNPYIGFKYSWLDIKFDLLKKSVKFHQNSMNFGNVPSIEMDLLKAINKQVEELGWK